MIVVIPTCRSIQFENLGPLIDYGARFIVIDDSEGSISIDHPQFSVINWGDCRRLLGTNEIAIPRKNGACRALGFYLAWKEADAGEAIVALDDDCVVESPDFPQQVMKTLGHGTRRISAGTGIHMNAFDVLRGLNDATIFPRGFPYSSRISYTPWTFDESVEGEIHFNLGLWRGTLDINAIDRLQMEANYFPDVELLHENVVIPRGTLVSLCAGNMQFRRELIPAFYQLPMNIEVMPKGLINRYGDIWAGFILKSLMDVREDGLSIGGPLVRHAREGPYLQNAVSEHLGCLVNEEFVGIIRQSAESIASGSYFDMMRHFHDNLRHHAYEASPILRRYLAHVDRTLGAWLGALSEC